MKYPLNLFSTISIVLCSANILAFGNLSADELQELISGNTAEGERREGVRPALGPPTMVENYPEYFVAYFDANGIIELKIDNTNVSGKWQITDRGKLCIAWQGRKEQCASVHKEGKVYKWISRKRMGRILWEMKFTRFTAGNEHGL